MASVGMGTRDWLMPALSVAGLAMTHGSWEQLSSCSQLLEIPHEQRCSSIPARHSDGIARTPQERSATVRRFRITWGSLVSARRRGKAGRWGRIQGAIGIVRLVHRIQLDLCATCEHLTHREELGLMSADIDAPFSSSRRRMRTSPG